MNFSLKGNWIDLIIVAVLIYFAFEGVRHGLWIILAEFTSFFISLLVSLRAYKLTADMLSANFNLPISVANALGFLLTAVIFEIILGYMFAYLISRLPEKLRRAKYGKMLGVIPSLGQGIILVSFVLMLLMGMPIRGDIKEDIGESKIGGFLVRKTSVAEKGINEIFGGVINDSLTYLTVKPNSEEILKLKVASFNLNIDETNEKQMFNLVNKERKDRGINELIWSDNIKLVARDYAKDMWQRQYFSHFSPEGEDVGDRLTGAKIQYYLAGENLALAPTLTLAHDGLMNSQGHRANILEKRFNKMGIGVVDNGYYGKIFVQVFSD